MRFEGRQRVAVALALLAGLAGLSWFTMEPGRTRTVVMILLAGFGLRIVLAARSSLRDDGGSR